MLTVGSFRCSCERRVVVKIAGLGPVNKEPLDVSQVVECICGKKFAVHIIGAKVTSVMPIPEG